ncbi:hypothetical protein H072_2922 [Dactylellina haptotyla CBS 200.50]|uniref:Uncharacterized protein n=1 Tax=Dactylellina haptotyla (strain CBS 200.50) TaxID=1284197 RepID=S8BUA1_DACHA|nr:hypothetical protein H072_2922 [Dactylellina haptotyla CBS 200.50]
MLALALAGAYVSTIGDADGISKREWIRTGSQSHKIRSLLRTGELKEDTCCLWGLFPFLAAHARDRRRSNSRAYEQGLHSGLVPLMTGVSAQVRSGLDLAGKVGFVHVEASTTPPDESTKAEYHTARVMATRLLRFAHVASRTAWLLSFRTPATLASPSVRSATLRFSSSGGSPATTPPPPPAGEKKVSPHVSVYSTYGRAFSKVLLMSLLVYQGLYYGWIWLEHLETKKVKGAEIQALEDKIRELQNRAAKLEEKKARQGGKL